ncbi:hypothetical protein QCB44_02400 [Thiomicrorhabdus sp. zzn3]|uniref:hypothetical protein n=1 Tax=Thiomicrorhabdus sp. zzn3 TaxID=3039775 RepID=UPI002436718F|nr:hypothetical protein [Thiomicrorhabdus sp. zzn3]MDG6777550.1 hypothetical protein [Thiomicrorhabdus sp. zzn3]
MITPSVVLNAKNLGDVAGAFGRLVAAQAALEKIEFYFLTLRFKPYDQCRTQKGFYRLFC